MSRPSELITQFLSGMLTEEAQNNFLERFFSDKTNTQQKKQAINLKKRFAQSTSMGKRDIVEEIMNAHISKSARKSVNASRKQQSSKKKQQSERPKRKEKKISHIRRYLFSEKKGKGKSAIHLHKAPEMSLVRPFTVKK